MFGDLKKLIAEVQEIRRTVSLIRKTLIRFGTVQLIDPVLCTVVVLFPGTDALGAPLLSLPVPWLQRSSEHRPPLIGDHAIVIDPSLGNGAGLAICGWTSLVKPAAEGGLQKHILYSGIEPCKVTAASLEVTAATTVKHTAGTKIEHTAGTTIEQTAVTAIKQTAPSVELGTEPTDFAALASKVDLEIARIWEMFSAWTPAAQDGGAALKALAETASLSVASVTAVQVKVK